MSDSPELVIFDCDGVLVDSERVANEVFARALDEVCGLEFTLEDMFDTFVGHSRLQCLQKIEALLGRPPPDAVTSQVPGPIGIDHPPPRLVCTVVDPALTETPGSPSPRSIRLLLFLSS